MSEKVSRRLTTVMCADVQGYTRLMEGDEVGTLTTLRRARSTMAALVQRHDGRIVNTWGDAVIAEFASVVEAVLCAKEIQQEIAEQDSHLPDAQRMRFRIGINLGDVMVDGSDIYGEGVNIAARLQELAPPGGILVSGPVYDQVRNKLSIGFHFLGSHHVKNVMAPVTTYRVSLDGTPDGAAFDTPTPTTRNETTQVQTASHWFTNLPRPIAAAIVISVFLFLINAFSGLREIWFHWPVTAIFLIVSLWAVLRRRPRRLRPSPDERIERASKGTRQV